MTVFEALVLGIIEGITEFLPISSTAHLVLAGRALGHGGSAFSKSFDIIIQFGAILSVVVLYWRKFLDWEVLKKLAVAFIPTGLIGLTVYRVLKEYLLDSLTVILLALILGGIGLIVFSRRRVEEREEIDFGEITYGRALLIGIFQAIAIVPGVSRSAATIVGGSMIGISKRTIVEFSFMLAVPTMLAATVYDLYKSQDAISGNYAALGVGFVVSFFTAILAIKWLLAYIKNRSFAAFGWYRIGLAIVYFLVFGR